MKGNPERRLELLLKEVSSDGEEYQKQPEGNVRSRLEGRIEGMITAAWLLDAIDHDSAQGLGDLHLKRKLTPNDLGFEGQ